jgi:hypothetical protein
MATTYVRPDRTESALRDLVDRGVITTEQAQAVRTAITGGPLPAPRGRWWAEVSGYVGGGLLLGGASLLLGAVWDGLTDPIRAALLAALAAAVAAAGLLIGGGPAGVRRLARAATGARRRVVAVLFAVAAGAATGAGAVFADDRPGTAAGVAGLAVALAGYAALPSVPGLLAVAGTSLLLFTSAAMDLGATSPFAVGLVYLALGAAWTTLAATGIITPRPVGLGVGATLVLIGAQQPLGQPGAQGWTYAMTFVAAVAFFVLYRWLRDVVLLIAGVLGMAVAAPEAVWDWTDGAAGGALVLLVAGAALVAAAAAGLGLWRAGTPHRT